MLRIIEVGPRDGLQNEATPIPTDVKAKFISDLAGAGITEIEYSSFVSPKWVPQLGDAAELFELLPDGPKYSALVPNARGLERAIEVGVDRIALFTAASDAFTQKNINMTVDESLAVFQDVAASFRQSKPNGWIRGYVSTVFECPYAGRIDTDKVLKVANALLETGVDEISLGDTIGVAVPRDVNALAKAMKSDFSGTPDQIVWHFHDTRGTAIANVAEALNWNPGGFDSSAGGLGGCPYAPGAGGNLATEDLVYFLERTGIPTGIDLDRLSRASLQVLEILGRAPSAKSQLASLSKLPLQ